MRKKPLLEYVLHPFNTIQNIYNYNLSQRSVKSTGLGSEKKRKLQTPPWLAQYFDAMYDYNRINLYAVYTEMGEDALVIAVLDAFAKACTQPNSEANREISGRVVWCHSQNKDVQKIVNDFLDRIEVHESSFEIIRSMFQFGDHFEAIPTIRNQGVIRMDPYDPWEVAVMIDENRKVKGFGQADDNGEMVARDTVVPYWEALHFRMPRRRRTDIYGVRASLLFGVREHWQDLQWVMDKIVVERLWRRPDRNHILLDVGGVSSEDAFVICEELRDRLYRDVYYDPQEPQLNTMPPAWSESRDVIIPTGADNKTSVTSAPASSSTGPIDDLHFYLRRFFGGMHFPPGYLGLDLGGSYDPSAPLEKQDLGFAQTCMGPQSSFLRVLTRAAMVHLAFQNQDPRMEKNRFVLMMNPINTFQELERKELIAMRFDLMDRAMSIGRDNEWNMNFWGRYVMEEYAHLPSDMVDLLLRKDTTPEEEDVMDQGDEEELFATLKKRKEYKALMEEVEKNPKVGNALTFFAQGASMASSKMVSMPELEELMEAKKKHKSEPIKVGGAGFKTMTEKRQDCRKRLRRELYERTIYEGGARKRNLQR